MKCDKHTIDNFCAYVLFPVIGKEKFMDDLYHGDIRISLGSLCNNIIPNQYNNIGCLIVCHYEQILQSNEYKCFDMYDGDKKDIIKYILKDFPIL